MVLWIAIAVVVTILAVYVFGLSGMSGFTAESDTSIALKVALLAAVFILIILLLL